MAELAPPAAPPRPYLLATVRNRRALVVGVNPSPVTPEGVFHAVSVEYLDADGPREEVLLGEHEPAARFLEPTALPDVHRLPPASNHGRSPSGADQTKDAWSGPSSTYAIPSLLRVLGRTSTTSTPRSRRGVEVRRWIGPTTSRA